MKKESFLADPVLQQRLAKYIVEQCFRNSQLEDLHAGTAPDSETGDYSDVVVKTPFGEIPWRNLSRFDDTEMKVLMQDVVNRTYRFIHKLFDEEQGGELLLRLANRDLVPQWDNPTLALDLARYAAEAALDLPASALNQSVDIRCNVSATGPMVAAAVQNAPPNPAQLRG